MIPVLVGLAALGGIAIASSGKSDGEWIEESTTRVTPESDDGSEKTTTRVIDESKVPEAVRREINIQEDDEIIIAIKKLGDLYKSGILTDEEFAAKKQELLSRL